MKIPMKYLITALSSDIYIFYVPCIFYHSDDVLAPSSWKVFFSCHQNLLSCTLYNPKVCFVCSFHCGNPVSLTFFCKAYTTMDGAVDETSSLHQQLYHITTSSQFRICKTCLISLSPPLLPFHPASFVIIIHRLLFYLYAHHQPCIWMNDDEWMSRQNNRNETKYCVTCNICYRTSFNSFFRYVYLCLFNPYNLFFFFCMNEGFVVNVKW